MLERARVITPEVPVVIVMPVRSSPQREDPSQTPREIVSRVRVDGLELTQSHPSQHSHQMHLAGEVAKDQRGSNRAQAKKHGLPWAGVLGRQTKRRGILMVHPMDGTIKRAPVEGTVEPVVIRIFDEEEDCDLNGEGFKVRKWKGVLKTEQLHHRVEQDYHRHFHNKVDSKDIFHTTPLFSC